MATAAPTGPLARFPEPLPLHLLRSELIEPLLSEEVQQYEEHFQWDFRPMAELVQRLVAERSLAGIALVEGGVLLGYGYYIIEDQKAVIGDVYLREAYSSAANERLLMASMLESIRTQAGIFRVEAQPMMLRFRYSHPRAERLERLYLSLSLEDWNPQAGDPLPTGFFLERWSKRRQNDGAQVIYQAYRNHVDARINDQYGGPGKARRFLENVIEFPGCGVFSPEASHLLIHLTEQRYCGMVCGSTIHERVGHITQLCVSPWVRQQGLGQALMREALRRFAEQGCESVTLTVTASNAPALRLYQRMGFVEKARVAAYVWPQWPA